MHAGVRGRSTLLQRLVSQLAQIAKAEVNVADLDVAQLITKFEIMLDQASQATKERIIIVIDALDEMESENHAQELEWLPVHFPAGCVLRCKHCR